MASYMCLLCGYVYNENIGYSREKDVLPIKWIDIAATWSCPDCGADKSKFEVTEEEVL